MPDVFTVLREDHQEVKDILAQLSAGDPAQRVELARDLAERLVIEESRHEAVEEMHFWPEVRSRVSSGEQLTFMALDQESEGKKVLDELRKAVPAEPAFAELVATFDKAAREHIAFEEGEVWPKLLEALSPAEREELGSKIVESKKSAPTRPHPHGPDKSGALKTVGMAAAVMDKARDAMTGRAQEG